MSMKSVAKILWLSLALAVVACGHDSPSEREPAKDPTDNNGGQRPGVGDANSLKHELDDGVWRVSGPKLSLRYDRGGVLFNIQSDGIVEIVDLDGADMVSIDLGTEGADSVMAGAGISVNGRAIDIRRMSLLRHGDGRSWYVATDDSDGQWVMVLP